MPKALIRGGIVCIMPVFQAGDQAPAGYLEWFEWARVQHKAGLRQRRCRMCGKWRYPQEKCCELSQRNTSKAIA